MVLGELVDVARVQQEQEVTFDQSEDDFETDDWDIEKMGDDFLIAGTPYPPWCGKRHPCPANRAGNDLI